MKQANNSNLWKPKPNPARLNPRLLGSSCKVHCNSRRADLKLGRDRSLLHLKITTVFAAAERKRAVSFQKKEKKEKRDRETETQRETEKDKILLLQNCCLGVSEAVRAKLTPRSAYSRCKLTFIFCDES